ncbi:MAG: YeeE/YedE family protein [Rhodospirillaceae bacterium]|nr:YeeE/YedE family protein [Rhodospirillaceae bacterium]
MTTAFTPIPALIGGALIGLAAVLLMLFNGRVAGISGITGQLLKWPPAADWPWRLAFVAGLVAAPLAVVQRAPDMAELGFVAGLPVMALAGFLVGFGSSFGSGCTSGHGVCGIARLSKRSILATVVFMTAGLLTVFVVRHVIGAGD